MILQSQGGQRWPRRWCWTTSKPWGSPTKTAGLVSGSTGNSSGGHWRSPRWWRVWASITVCDGNQDISEARILFYEMITTLRLNWWIETWWHWWRWWSQLLLTCGRSRWLQSGLRSTWISLCGWSISQLDFNICHIRGIRKTAVVFITNIILRRGVICNLAFKPHGRV